MNIKLSFMILLLVINNPSMAVETGFQLEIDAIENKVNLADRQMVDWNNKYKGYKQSIDEIVRQSAQSEHLSDRYYAHFQIIKSQALILRDLANDYQIIKYQLRQIHQQNKEIKQALLYYQQPLIDGMVRGETNMIQAGLNFNQNKRREAEILFMLFGGEINKSSDVLIC